MVIPWESGLRLIALEVQNFGCVRASKIEFAPGLNVLFGPNDLGKSTLIAAIRSVLLLPHSSTAASGFAPWREDAVPEVSLTLEAERYYRVTKRFASGSRGSSVLDTSKDGVSWTPEARSRQVDDELRKALRLGLPGPGGRGGSRNIQSFLTTLLLPTQSGVMDVFDKERGLTNDPDDSGYTRLTDALSAMARDPVFAAMLARAQARVDEAFTATGRLKRTADAPLTLLREELAEVESALSERQREAELGDRIRESLRALFAARADARATRAEADEAWASADRYRNAMRARDEALAVVREHEAARAVLAKAEQECEELDRAAKKAAQAELRAEERLVAADEARGSAAKEVERVRAAGDAGRELRRSTLATRIAELEREQDRASQRLREAKATLELAQNLESAEKGLDQEEDALERRSAALAQKEAERDKIVEELAILEIAGQLLGVDEARTALEKSAGLAKDAAAHREQARALDAQATEDAATARAAPTAEALARAVEIDVALREAHARASVGIHVSVRSDRAVDVDVTVDGEGEDSSSVGATPRQIAGRREVRLLIDGQTEVNAEAGGEAERVALRELEVRFQEEVAPLLASAGVDDVDGLRRRVAAAGAAAEHAVVRKREADRERASADRLYADASAQQAIGADLPRLLAAIADAPVDLARARLEGLAAPVARSLEEQVRRTRKALDALDAELGQLRVAVAAARAQLGNQRKEASKARALLDQRMAEQDGDDPQRFVDAMTARSEAFAMDLQAALAERDQAATEEEAGERAAIAGVELAEAARAAAAKERGNAAERRSTAERQAAEQRGRVQRLREVQHAIDEDSAKAKLAGCEAVLAELEDPGTGNSDEALQRLRAAADRAKSAVDEIEREIGRSEGALETAGGVVAREETARLRESKARLQERQLDTELDYEAWRLLVETMTTVESEQSIHLGRSVMPKIEERFADLTNARYGGLVLGPNLEAEGVAAAGDTRAIGDLSVGTQEQLSTIFRLVLAEELRSAVLLDDQLTQTDPRRMRFFRERLRQAAAGIQVLVVTCHPEDYLGAAEVPPGDDPVRDSGLVRAIDLERVVDRR